MVLPDSTVRPGALTAMQREDSRAKLMVPAPVREAPSPPKKETPAPVTDLADRIKAELSDQGSSEKDEEPEELVP